MNNKQTSSLIILLFILFLIKLCCASFKRKYTQNNFFTEMKYRKKNTTEVNLKRNLEDEAPKGNDNLSYYQLSIFLDKTLFNKSFPDNLKSYQDDFNSAMNKAKEILEDLLEVYNDVELTFDFSKNYIQNNYGLAEDEYDHFLNDTISMINYNYFFFASFTDQIKTESASVIIDELSGQPLSGIILLNKNFDESRITPDYLLNLMLHHFIRLLGFHEDVTVTFSTQISFDEINDRYYLSLEGEKNFSNVINYARKYFNCNSIERIDLFFDEENYFDEESEEYSQFADNDIIGLYWPKRLFLGELMTKFDYPEEQILSGFTLAFLDDLPYLRVVKNYTGGLMKFGKNKGCDFFFNKCGNFSVSPSTFANEFYLPKTLTDANQPSCSSGRLSKTIYKLQEITPGSTDTIEFGLGVFGGPKSTNYCPIAQYDYDDDLSHSRTIYNGHCSEINSNEKDNDRHEYLGIDSFCVLSSLVDESSTDTEIKALCYQMICGLERLTIKINNDYIVCPREGGKIKAKNFHGYLLCPDYYLICSSSQLCNNFLNCYEKNSTELNESFYYDYEIQTTQDFDVYNPSNINYAWESSINGICPINCRQCKSETDCTNCRPHYDFHNGECKEVMPLCENFEDEESNICKKCKGDYFLVEKTDGRYCQNDDITKYYLYIDNTDLKVYKKCEIENCQKCIYAEEFETKVKCDLCVSPFIKVDNGLICGDFNSKLYYEESTNTYKSCIKHGAFNNCLKCNNEGTFTCLECNTGFVLYHGTTPSCISIESINPTMYTIDNKNYYPCNNREYNDVDNCEECNKKDECSRCSGEYTLVNENKECILTIDINNKKYYQDPSNNFYYLCKNNCETCLTETKCINCRTSFLFTESDTCIDPSEVTNKKYYLNGETGRYSKCSNIPGCYLCESGTECITCDNSNGFYFVKGEDNKFSCQKIEKNKYYEITEGEKTYYRQCSKAIDKCDKCSASDICDKCITDYGIVDNDYTNCVKLEDKFYYDTNLSTYKLCSYKMTNCELCSGNENFLCKKCFSGYALKYTDTIECNYKSSLEGDVQFFPDEEGINYYLCSLYNDVKNCSECSNKKTCDKCKIGYDKYNNNTLCVAKEEKEANYYAYTNDGLLKPCSDLMQKCLRCNESTFCIECQNNGALIDGNNTCVDKSEIERTKTHFRDETTNRYISCSIMDNCVNCDSSTVCISCQEGFTLKNNKCTPINNKNDSDDGLGTGAIIGIVFGCLGFLLIVAGVVFFLLNKVFLKDKSVPKNEMREKVEIAKENDEKDLENNLENAEEVIENNTNQVKIHTTKRSIHNA